MTCYFAKTLSCTFDEAGQRTIAALKQGGFGIITEIAIKETFRKNLDADFRNSATCRRTPCISTGTS